MTEALPPSIANTDPLPVTETERLEALRRYKILDTPPEMAFDRITSLAARLFDVPIVLVSLLDESRAWFKSCYGFNQPEVPRHVSLCNFALSSNDVLVIPDARQDDRFASNPFVQGEPGVRFYAGAPLLTSNAINLGALCLVDTKPRAALTDEQKATLTDLAAMVMDELELRLAARKVAQIDAALLEVTQGVAAVTGKAFFNALVQHLSKVLGVNYACISLLVNENPEKVKTIAFCNQGEIIDNVEYELQGTPCLNVVRQQKLGCYTGNLQALFPDDLFLVALNIESYASIPFFNSQGKLLGLLSVMDNKPIENVQLVESLLTLFAMRIAVELERHQAEEMRQEAAQRLQLYADVVRNTQVGILVWQLEDSDEPNSFRLLLANPAASETAGLNFEPMIGKTMAESFPNFLQTSLLQQCLEVVRTGRSCDLGEVNYAEDGISAGIYSLKAFPLPDNCLGLAFENITACKQLETQLEESQRYNQQIAEAVPGVLFVHDIIQQQNVYTNRQITDLLGYSSKQVQAMGKNAVAILVHPDDLQRVATYYKAFDSAPDDAVLGIEYRARHASGEWLWLYSQSVVFNRTTDGLPRQILGVSIDITDRKRSEQALQESEAWTRLVTQVAQLGGWRLHLDTNLVELDTRMRQIWGEPDGASLIPLPTVLERIHPDDRQRVASAVSAAIDPTSSGTYEIEYRLVWNDGTERWILAKGQARFEGEGTARGVVDFFGTSLDITDRKQAEALLVEQEQRYRYIFEAVNVAIWEEDFTEAKAAIDQLKATGVQDFRQYFAAHPEVVQQMLSSVQVQDVNQAALQMFGAQEKAELLASLDQIFVPETQAAFIEELLAIANQETFFAAETVLQTLQGDRLDVWFTITFPPASKSYDRVLVSLLDITQRKQAETALQASEERLSLALRSAQAGMWQWFKANGRSIWSDENFRLMGYEPGQIAPSYETWIQAIHPDDRDMAQHAMQQTLNENGSLYFEYRVCLPDGSVRWLADIGQITYDQQGNQEGMIGIQIDISKRKQSELERERSEVILNAFLTASPIALTLFDPDLHFIYANEAMAQINDLPLSQHIGHTLWEVVPDMAAQFAPLLRQIIATQEPVLDLEYCGEVKPGVYRHTIANHFPVCLPDGEVLGVGVTVTDISELKRVEAELRQHSERLNLLYETTRGLLSAAHPLDLMNQLFSRLSVQLELHYYYHFQLVEQEGQQRLRLMNYAGLSQEQAQAFESIGLGQAMCGLVAQERRQIVLNQAEIATHPNAKIIDSMGISAYAGQPLMVHGRLLGTLSFASRTRTQFSPEEVNLLQAISEQVAIALNRAELVASLQQQAEDLAQANRIKDEFLAVLSHELRSPLNPILGWAKLLQKGTLNEQMSHHALETIERNAKLQTQLIDDLLDVSRILRGKMALTTYPTNLVTVVESALETVRLAAEAKQIQIKTSVTLEHSQVLGDATRLQQIVWNLLSNAIKFTPNNGQVTICLVQNGMNAQIQVKDTGKGIAPDFLPYVFDYFRQEDGKTTRKFGGLGLGLAIVRHLTELHGGTVQAASPGEGQGATFTVQLPLMTQPTTPESRTPVAAQLVDLSQWRILIVDDNEDMRALIQVILEQRGAQVTVATSAAEVLRLFDQQPPDLLISDIGMPETNGYMLMQQIRNRSPEAGGLVPAIALTAYAGEYNQQQALASGFQQHIPKPVEPETLVSAIARLLDRV